MAEFLYVNIRIILKMLLISMRGTKVGGRRGGWVGVSVGGRVGGGACTCTHAHPHAHVHARECVCARMSVCARVCVGPEAVGVTSPNSKQVAGTSALSKSELKCDRGLVSEAGCANT